MTLILSLILSYPVHAALPPRPAADQAVHALSLSILDEGGMPDSPPTINGLEGLLAPKVPRQFRHMHAMVTLALYSGMPAERAAGWRWLDSYQCENAVACLQFHKFFEDSLRARGEKQTRQQKVLAKEIRRRARNRMIYLNSQQVPPPGTGLCEPAAARSTWLAIGYQLYCPPYPGVKASVEGCGVLNSETKDCSSTAALRDFVLRSSRQDELSTSFLEGFVHRGTAGCDRPWIAELECGGKTAKTYSVRCTKSGSGYPLKITCAEIASK